MTNKFKLVYPSGVTEEVYTDAVDVADQINRTFGLTVAEAAEFGVSVELIAEGHGEEPPETEPDTPNSVSTAGESSSATVTIPLGAAVAEAPAGSAHVPLGTAVSEAPATAPMTPPPPFVPTASAGEPLVPVHTPEQVAPDTPTA